MWLAVRFVLVLYRGPVKGPHGPRQLGYSCQVELIKVQPFFPSILPSYLRLGEAQLGSQVGPLGQGEVLGLLEALVQRLELQARVDGPRLADLLALPVQPDLPILDHRGGLLVLWGGTDENKTIRSGHRGLQTLGRGRRMEKTFQARSRLRGYIFPTDA